ncbi:restriction endonuclease subunit S [Pseudoxanthomonas mexicana]
MIPDDWEERTLQNCARGIVRGASPRPIDDPKWFDDRSPVGWLRISDVTSAGRFLTTTTQRLSEAGIRHSRKVPAGSLVMSICATVGRPIETRIDVCIHDGFVLFDKPDVEQDFLYHVLTDLEPRWTKKGQTGSQMNLNTGLIKGTKIAVPKDGVEQSAIATTLSDVDALLAAQDALIAKKRAIKQGAMQELLTGKRRLSGFDGEWEVKRLDQLAEIRSGGTPSTSRPDFWDGDILWVTPTDVSALDGRKFLETTKRKITELGLKASSAEIIPASSVVMTTRATIGECAINVVPLSTNQGFKNFVPRSSVDVGFLFYLLTTQKQGFIGMCAGSTFLEIGKAQLAGYEVFIPEKGEQLAIAEVLSDMDAELTALEIQRAKTTQLKQGMMQALLTGRIRLV